jgi:hypothetical protein
VQANRIHAGSCGVLRDLSALLRERKQSSSSLHHH